MKRLRFRHRSRDERWVWTCDQVTLSQCAFCAHLGTEGDSAVCTAFPAAIPQAILSNLVDHRRPLPGDQGVRFEPRLGVKQWALDRLYATLAQVTGQVGGQHETHPVSPQGA